MWHEIIGHDAVADRFRRVLAEGRLASTYLFVGPGGVGKRLFARRLAQSLFCTNSPDTTFNTQLTACENCKSCLLLAAGNHPDLFEIGFTKDKSGKMRRALAIDQFIGRDTHRHREGLCHDLSRRPMVATRRVAIIDHADTFTETVANSLLKTLEEPPPHSLLILIGTSEAKQIPTIRSRSQVIRFDPLAEEQLQTLLLEQDIAPTPEAAGTIAALAGGSLDRARELASEEMWRLNTEAIGLLVSPVIDSPALAEKVYKFAEAAGKEAPEKRTALVAAIGLVTEHYRRQLRSDPNSTAALQVADRIDRCLEAEEHVGRNAHLQTLIQSWADDLARM